MIGTRLRASRFFHQGQALFTQNRLHEAIVTLTEAASLHPRSAGIRLHLALALAEAERFQEASNILQQAIDLQPRNAVLPMFLGQIAMDAGDYPEARTWCERALQLSPYNCHTVGLLALLDLLQDKPQQGAQRLLQPVPMPIPPLERAALWLCRSRVTSLLQQGNSALQSRFLLLIETLLLPYDSTAQTLTQQLLATEQLDNPVLLLLDRALTRGVMALRRAMTLGTSLGANRAHRLLALHAEEAAYLGERSMALKLYQRLLQQSGDFSLQAHQHLTQLHYEQGAFRQALTHLQHVLQVRNDTPMDTSTALVLGELLYYVGRYSEAVEALKRATEAPLIDYKPLYYLGLCALRNGQPRTARQYFVQAVRQLNPDIATLRLQEWCRVTQV